MAKKKSGPNQWTLFDDWLIVDESKGVGESQDKLATANDSVLPEVEKTFENHRHALSLQLAEKLVFSCISSFL